MDAVRDELLTHIVLHADETPVAMLAPGKKQTQWAYVWVYAATHFALVQGAVYDIRSTSDTTYRCTHHLH